MANVQNVPLFRDKGEYRFSGTYSMGTESVCYELQGAGSVTGSMGIMANFMWAKGIDNESDSWAKGPYLDAAAGYFKPIKEHGVFEVYGGAGWSNQDHVYRNTLYDPIYPAYGNPRAGTSEASFIKVFIQPSIGMIFDAFEFAFSTRFNRLTFYKVENDIDRVLNDYEFDKISAIAGARNYSFFEPALTLRAGWERVKIQFRVQQEVISTTTDMTLMITI